MRVERIDAKRALRGPARNHARRQRAAQRRREGAGREDTQKLGVERSEVEGCVADGQLVRSGELERDAATYAARSANASVSAVTVA